MSSPKNDILAEIPTEDLPKLALLFEKHVDWAPHVSNLIKTGICLKQSHKYCNYITFLSVETAWTEDGTIIILQTFHCYNIFVFTLDEQCINLRRGLSSTNLLNYKNEHAVFFCVHEKHIPVINQVITDLNLKATKSHVPYLMYALAPEVGRKTGTPSGVKVQKLHLGLVEQINSAWPYNFKGSEDYIGSLIEMYGGYGLFLDETNELVAWILRYNLGHVGILQTKDKYKKRGFGTHVTKVLVDNIVKEGNRPFATISATNFVSVSLFERLGFENIGECSFFKLSGFKNCDACIK
ncbi:uncharacterized protein LOC135265202 [Tribolium castaneum]|nr:PREDICTED: uncharacterized protein LOC664557 [Tribolium castaneum]|eukprot:XP_008196057.2 PREDICTED: uncharacterized protein LOC664557 [Tribolium castaneum]